LPLALQFVLENAGALRTAASCSDRHFAPARVAARRRPHARRDKHGIPLQLPPRDLFATYARLQ
jgi:hypothetical protein